MRKKLSSKVLDGLWRDWVEETKAAFRNPGVSIDSKSFQTILPLFSVVKEFELWCSSNGLRIHYGEFEGSYISGRIASTKSHKKAVLLSLKYE